VTKFSSDVFCQAKREPAHWSQQHIPEGGETSLPALKSPCLIILLHVFRWPGSIGCPPRPAWAGASFFSQQSGDAFLMVLKSPRLNLPLQDITVCGDTSLSALKSPHLILLMPFNNGLSVLRVLSSHGLELAPFPSNTFLLVATPLFRC
jgi:hypothetical protein